MANHEGYVFIAPDGRYLVRRDVLSHGGKREHCWELTTCLDTAELFSYKELDPIRPLDGFDDIARHFDITPPQLRDILTPVAAKSSQKIEIGWG